MNELKNIRHMAILRTQCGRSKLSQRRRERRERQTTESSLLVFLRVPCTSAREFILSNQGATTVLGENDVCKHALHE